MNNNIINFFMNLINSGGNPQQITTQMLQQQSKNNPIAAKPAETLPKWRLCEHRNGGPQSL